MKTVCVIGLGYVGLPTALLLAEYGYRVFGFDTNLELVDDLSNGIYRGTEPEIQALISTTLLKNTFIPSDKITKADTYIICVPTPINEQTKRPQLESLNDAIAGISDIAEPGNLVILESTSPIGTTKSIYDLLIEKIKLRHSDDQTKILVAYCPERILPGSAISELTSLDRVIGGYDIDSAIAAAQFFSKITNGNCIQTTAEIAEFVKLAENSFRDVNIAFANELRNLCDNNSVDHREVVRLANAHPRVQILDSGIGVGGHCIPVDPWFLVDLIKSKKNDFSVVRAARQVNDFQISVMFEKIMQFCKSHSAKNIMLMGVAYKPDSDDIRNSPSLMLAKRLIEETELNINICDPFVAGLPSFYKKCLIPIENIQSNLTSDIYFVLVKHQAFKIPIERLRNDNKIVFSLV